MIKSPKNQRNAEVSNNVHKITMAGNQYGTITTTNTTTTTQRRPRTRPFRFKNNYLGRLGFLLLSLTTCSFIWLCIYNTFIITTHLHQTEGDIMFRVGVWCIALYIHMVAFMILAIQSAAPEETNVRSMMRLLKWKGFAAVVAIYVLGVWTAVTVGS